MAANGFSGFNGVDGGPGKGNVEGTSYFNPHNQHLTAADDEQLAANVVALSLILESQQEPQDDSAYNSPGGSEKSGNHKASRPHFPQTPKPLSAAIGTGARSMFSFEDLANDGINRNGNKVDHQKICAELMAKISKLLPNEDYSDLMDVKVSWIEKYNSFWIRSCLLGRQNELESLLLEMEIALAAFTCGEPTVNTADVGGFLLVPNGQQGMCRAQVLHIEPVSGYVTVLLIDHGFISGYRLSMGLYAEPLEWKMSYNLRPLAIRARMPEIDYAFLPDDTKVFEQAFQGIVNLPLLRGTIQRVAEDGYAEVSLEYGPWFKNLGQKLCMFGTQRPKPGLNPTARTKGLLRIKPGIYEWKLKELENAAVVYMWPEENFADRLLSKIKEDLRILLDKMPAIQTTIPQVKDFVGVRINGEWFRGIVRGVNYETCDCFLMDVGVMENVPIQDVLPLVDQRAFQLPALALECSDAAVAAYLGDVLQNNPDPDNKMQSLNTVARELLLPFLDRNLKVEVLEFVPEGQLDMQGWVENDYAMVNLSLNGKTGPVRYSEVLQKAP